MGIVAPCRMPIVFVISAPSGTGKSTLANAVLAHDDRIEFATSVTTRAPRGQETEGREYRFVTRGRFLEMRDRGEFIEWAEVFGHLYGTPWSAVEEARKRGRDLLLDIDVQGASLLIKKLPSAVKIFILPPSSGKLALRLRNRSSDDDEVIERRLGEASREVNEFRSYDYVVVNDEIERSIGQLRAILSAERSKRQRMERAIQPILRGFGINPDAGAEEGE